MQAMQSQESESETSDENCITEHRKITLDNFKRKLALGDSASSSESDIESEDEKVSDKDKEIEGSTLTPAATHTPNSTEAHVAAYVTVIG